MKKPPPFKGLNIRIPVITPIMGRGFINHGSALPLGFVPIWFGTLKPKPHIRFRV